MLKITNFKKSYNKDLILQIDNLTIESGISWIRGANGTGKSTFLKSAAGIIAFEGDLSLASDVSIKAQPVAYRKLVNFAEAEPVFPEFLTGTDLIRLFTKAKDAPVKQADYFVETMKMGSYVSDPVGTFSSGMLKKLSLLLAFIGNPKLILLDEPLITMDSQALQTLYGWIDEYYSKKGTSFLLSSHQALDESFPHGIRELLVAGQTLKYI
ncbi:ATP-binding cassette domain-containing protein [Dyadobacter subterraneus]|uniref:AAA family ATPase n=1 Tax=Dyadobacter subterraneus TaxID=2773304 RepID=A0ABR9WDN0_9BACT|nr:ATP-binding cassette domain-containing protein [Dyadobacter subterraneus]MBE9463589.1 AAA family ATPase [Dyadobacter subterraneus]